MLLSLTFLLVHALLLAPARSDTMQKCPDGTLCIASGTCCKLLSGRYSCCRLANAACCTTRNSCCPENYVCEPSSNHCVRASTGRKTTITPLTSTTGAVIHNPEPSVNQTPIAAGPLREIPDPGTDALMQKCPADDIYCFQHNNTCCRLVSRPEAAHNDTFGCCPDKDAVCCADKINCCARGFTCIGDTGNCEQTAPIGSSGELLPSGLHQDAPFKPRRVSPMRIVPGRLGPLKN